MQPIQLKCNSCGAMMNLDLDNLSSYCPYCGNKILIDMDQFGKVFAEKQKTERVRIKEETKQRRIASREEQNRMNNEAAIKMLPYILLLVIVLFAFMIITSK